jgi:uncharacterized membrane protein
MTDTALLPARSVPPRQLAWLRSEVADWTTRGIITPDQAARISDSYRADLHTRLNLGRIMLTLGGAFVGIGLIWLVAANLDQLSPAARFVAVAAFWLAFLAGGEALAARRSSPALVGAIRLLAALGTGAVIFQAAQSLQVPAFEPRLVGLWGAGALLHGYLVRAHTPFVVGLLAGLGWWFAQPLWTEQSGLTVVVLLGAASVLAAGLAVVHDDRLPRFARAWRTLAGAMALLTLFAAAIPDIGSDGVRWTPWLVANLSAAGIAAVAALVTGTGVRRLEPVGALAVLAAATLLSLWSTGSDTSDIDASDWLHAAVSVVAYVALAVALVALGTVRDHAALTAMAMVGLVVFTTFQSFAVFAPIVTGAWLFVVLGTVFLGTGFVADRGRRGLAQALDAAGTDTDASNGASR